MIREEKNQDLFWVRLFFYLMMKNQLKIHFLGRNLPKNTLLGVFWQIIEKKFICGPYLSSKRF